ncbi:N-acetylneuraminate lyase [Marinivivus vitaminiproducens]|uniref:N-acetylneuraminate lyase n=1 Tax=Marinivivus vitaminiproducens TaxID=3035935 RepID=UPI00279C97FF|nr:N-acetylneuraminate lyase [Geminicoccaceae bacterium SCSIO 64248]
MAAREIYSALVTPYGAHGGVDRDGLGRLLEFQRAMGLSGVYVGGSSGEAMLQTVDERADVIKAVAELNPGIKLIAHIGAIATRDALSLSDAANESGYDAVSAISPFYYTFSDSELVRHYYAIADRSAVPLVVYSFPAKGLGLTPELCTTLLAHPNIAGVKYTSADLYMLDTLKRANPGKIFYNGFDEIFLAGLSMGADGAIGTTYNFMGDVFCAIDAAFAEGRMAEALELQGMANAIIAKLYRSIISGTKYVLARMDVPVGGTRLPIEDVDWAAVPGLQADIDGLTAWRESRR